MSYYKVGSKVNFKRQQRVQAAQVYGLALLVGVIFGLSI
jgi:hypothetical protein